MGIAERQDLPEKPRRQEPWTFRRLFPFAGVASAISKTFSNPFDILLGYLVLVLGVAEVLGRKVSIMMWVFAIFILLADLAERHKMELSEPKVKKDKK